MKLIGFTSVSYGYSKSWVEPIKTQCKLDSDVNSIFVSKQILYTNVKKWQNLNGPWQEINKHLKLFWTCEFTMLKM